MKESDIVISLIKSAILKTELDEPTKLNITPDKFKEIYRISKFHDVAHLIGYALDKNGLIPSDSNARPVFTKEIGLAIYRYEKNNYEEQRICQTLEQAKIQHVPLKGSVIRKYYPEPWMRTSADIDVLVKETDLERAITVLTEELKYTKGEMHSHDVSLTSMSNVHLELHYNLITEGKVKGAEEFLKSIWDYVKVSDGYAYKSELLPEMFYFYHLAHAGKHFENGGCGIRPFLDAWLYKQGDAFDSEKLAPLLKKGELETFNDNFDKLIDYWFNNAEKADLTDKMEQFVLNGGIYGTQEQRVTINRTKQGGSKFKYVWNRFFLKYDVLKFMYPVLQKRRWLTPFCQVHRWFKLLFTGGAKHAINDLKVGTQVSNEQANETATFLSDIGIIKK